MAPITFSVGKPRLDRKHGTASIKVTLPTSGTLSASGTGVRRVTRSVPGRTTVTVVVKAMGAAAKTLRRRHRVTLAVKLTFVPKGRAAVVKRTSVGLKFQ